MPVPTLLTDLSATIASNSPAGSDNVFPDLDGYLRSLSGFLASIRDNSGNGWVSPYATKASPVLTGVVSNALGTEALPSYSFTGDLDTGAWSPSANAYAISTGGVERFRLDAAGNAGLGVVPSAWNLAGYKAFEIGSLGNGIYSGLNDIILSSNTYYNSGFKYAISTYPASIYEQNAGAHYWKVAPSGTAGNPITFTQAMTLDASGRLLVGVTGAINASAAKVQSPNGFISATDNLGIRILNTAQDGGGSLISNTGLAGGISLSSDGGPMIFSAGGGEAARFNTSKNLLVGTTSGIGRVVTNSGAAGNTSHGFGIVGLGDTNGATGGFFSVRMVTINGDGGTSSGNTFVSNVYGTKGVCIAAFDSSGNSVSPSTGVANSNLCTFVAIVSI